MRCAVVFALLCALLAPAAAWAQPPGVVAEGSADGRARLIVDGSGPVAVTVDGQPQPLLMTPVLSDRSAMALVVDASTEGGAGLQPGLGGLVDFALATPPTTRTTLVADTTPPAVVTPLQPGPSSVLPGLSGITPRGDRQTAAALDLATAQLPRDPDSPRLVVLYTAADGTDVSADDLAARLRAAGVVLAVVTTGDDRYWAAVAAGTGGMAVGTRPAAVVDAFAQIGKELRTCSLVTLPAPARTATPAVVRVGPVAVDTVIPPASDGRTDPVIILAAVVAGIVTLALAGSAIALLRSRVRRVRKIPDPAASTVARRRLLAAIERALTARGPVVVRGADGRAGMGVTTAMVEFAHRYRDAYDVVWWIGAQDPQLIGDQMARLAEALGVAAPTDAVDRATTAALAALRQRGRWLLIFDDAGSPRDLARFLPGGAGHVLVGSADPEWGEEVAVTVPPFARANSVRLLRARRDGLTEAEADRVAQALADVPLDVDAAGATLAATDMSVDAYLDAVSTARSGDAGSNAVWSVAFDRLAADDPPALALLTLVAWMGPEPVPLALLTEHPDHLPSALAPTGLATRATTLWRRGLARADGQGVLLHRVPAAHLVRRTAEERPDGASWATWVVRLLRAAVPPDPNDPATWPIWRQLMPHVLAATDPRRRLDDVAVDVGWLLQQAAGFLRARGEQESARALLEDAHDLYRQKLGPDDPQTRTAACALADNLRALGRSDRT